MNSVVKKARRRPSHASVASAWHRRPRAGEPAEVRFHAPDRDEHAARHAVLLRDRREIPAMLALLVGGGANEGSRQPALDVLIDRQHDFRLRSIALDDDLERFEIRERGIGRRRADAGGERLFLEVCERNAENSGRGSSTGGAGTATCAVPSRIRRISADEQRDAVYYRRIPSRTIDRDRLPRDVAARFVRRETRQDWPTPRAGRGVRAECSPTDAFRTSSIDLPLFVALA